MARFSPAFLDELRARVSLADLIGRTVTLRKRGREHTGLCPFHNEKTPSFTVNEDKGFYHCFGCGAHGDAIGFLQHQRGLTFPEAVEELAGLAGVALPAPDPRARAAEARRADDRGVVAMAAQWFQEQLHGGGGRAARDYLAGRGLDDATVLAFGLGWAPAERDALIQGLGARGLGVEDLVRAGLVGRDETGRTWDRFRGRVMFPITDRRGAVIAFGGRVLGDGQPKYLNSPDTDLFDKGRTLYGLAQAVDAARAAGTVAVVEGYMDVIALHRAGLAHVVAPLGTAVTEAQIALLWRLAPEPVLCFDGDAAGRRAAFRAAERALPGLAPGRSLRFAFLPAGEDPDSLVRRRGRAAMDEVIAGARPLDGVLWLMATEGQEVDTPERRAAVERRLMDWVDGIQDRTVQYQYRSHLRQRLRDAFGGWRPRGAPIQRIGAEALDGRGAVAGLADRRAQILLAVVLHCPAVFEQVEDALGEVDFESENLDRVRREILHVLSHCPLDTAALRAHLVAQGLGPEVDAITAPAVAALAGLRGEVTPERALRVWADTLAQVRRAQWQRELDEAGRALAQDAGRTDLVERIVALQALLAENGPVD